MARSKELTPTMRARLCELRDIGWSYRQIHQRYPDIPLSTIRYTISKQSERTGEESLRRNGRPKGLSPEEQQHIISLFERNPHIKMRELALSVQSVPSIRTVQRLLRRTQHAPKGKQYKDNSSETIKEENRPNQ